jgi:hypothetical protein
MEDAVLAREVLTPGRPLGIAFTQSLTFSPCAKIGYLLLECLLLQAPTALRGSKLGLCGLRRRRIPTR